MVELAELSVCACCLLLAANGECCDEEHPTPTVMLLLGGEELGFSWSACEGCRSKLGGDRYRAYVEVTK